MNPIEPWVDSAELRRLADALLASPIPPEPERERDPAYGDDFEGYAGDFPIKSSESPEPTPASAPTPAAESAAVQTDPPSGASGVEQHARNALAMARDIAQRGGLLGGGTSAAEEGTGVNPAPVVPPLAQLTEVTPVAVSIGSPDAPRSPFVARLQAYGAWLRDGIRAKSFFVTDRDGGVLIDEVQSPKLQQVARTLAQASRTANRQAGTVSIGNLHIKIAPEMVLEVVPVTTTYGPLILGIIVDQPLSPRNVETVAQGLQKVIDAGPGQ